MPCRPQLAQVWQLVNAGGDQTMNLTLRYNGVPQARPPSAEGRNEVEREWKAGKAAG